MDRGVRLEVVAVATLPQKAERLPGAEAEAGVRGERDRDVEVEDLLRDALVGVLGDEDEDEDDREEPGEDHGAPDHRRARVRGDDAGGRGTSAEEAVPMDIYSVTTYSNVAHDSIAKMRS